jgi:hypothetical protein
MSGLRRISILPGRSEAMRGSQRLVAFVVAFSCGFLFVVRASAHGMPILLGLDPGGSKLMVSGGLADTQGFAPMIFVEDDEDGEPFGELTLGDLGNLIIWQIPGYDITGLAENSGLYLDVISRPFAHAMPAENRVLWYANAATAKVETTPAANPLSVIKTPTNYETLSPTDGTELPPFKIAAPVSSDMGTHIHLVAYGLSKDTEPPEGAYGFFARLTSDVYQPSEPFLVVLNKDVFDYGQMVPAAQAINAAAFLPGDYNHDERVDAADYVVWRKTFGSSTELAADGSYNDSIDADDYGIWRSNFGAVNPVGGVSIAAVPEPPVLLSLAASFPCCWLIFGRAVRQIVHNISLKRSQLSLPAR